MGKKSKVDQIYEYLFHEMINLNYRQGDKIVISRIAKECNVSEIPVREALRRMESDGYVEIIPNRGPFVLGIEKRSLIEYVQIKGVLEGYATYLSVDNLSKRDLQELREINQQMKEYAQVNERDKASELNQQFHMKIYSVLPEKALTNMIADLWDKWKITKKIFFMAPSVMEESYQEHEKIIELIEDKKYDEVEMYVRRHKLKAVSSWHILGNDLRLEP